MRALERAGFILRGQGKHISMFHAEKSVVAILPRHNPVRRGTLARILKDIDLPVEEFVELL